MKKIFGNIENFSLEHRIFNLVAIIAFLSCQYIWINAVSLDLPITISSASSLIGIIIGIFYYFSRFKNKFTFLIWPLLILLLLLFSTNWFFSSGYDGTTFFGHLATFCAALMLLSKRSIIIFILIYILNFTFLIFFQMNYPETIMPYQNQSIEFIDKINTMIIISIVLYFMISLLVDNYRIERKKLKEQRNELRERNDIIEKELEMARKIQLNLIPSISPNSNIAFYYQPMDKVGGDFFEFIEYNNKDLLGVFISDVSGHGLPAAFITSMVKGVIMQKDSPIENPAEFLIYLNAALWTQIENNFITVFYGIYDKKKNTLTCSNAGHQRPFLINEKAQKLLIDKSSVPLGIMKNNELFRKNKQYQNEIIELPKPSKLFFYTDGISEAANPENINYKFEDGPMEDFINRHKDKNSKIFISDLYESLVEFRGAPSFEDDICMISMDIV